MWLRRRVVRDRPVSRAPNPERDGTMTWLEILLMVALLLIALGLAR
jgi:hypothetical protein